MPPASRERKLTTILAADVVGYSRLMAADQEGTWAQLKANRVEVIEPKTQAYRGRLIKLMGDGLLMEFESVADAVLYSVDVQKEMQRRTNRVPEDRRIIYRIGINVGDVIVDGDDVYGHGVNVASRLEALAEPGGVAISDDAKRLLGSDPQIDWTGGETIEVKNIEGGVQCWFWTSAEQARQAKPKPDDTGRATKPSVFVLPFANFTSDPEMEFLADGLVEDLLTSLQRFRLVNVNSRTSSFKFKGQDMDFGRVASETGADFIVEGSVRRAGNMVRVTAQLIAAESDRHLWADRFDGSMDDPLRLQADMATAINAAIEPVLVESINASGRDPTGALDHRNALRRAGWHLYRFTQADNARAIDLLEQAIRENPNADRRYQALAMGHLWDATFCWTRDVKASIRRAVNAAETAVSINGSDAWNLVMLGWARVFQGEPAMAIATVDRAIELNVDSGVPHGVKAWVAAHVGDADAAIKSFDRVLKLTPQDPFMFQYLVGGSLAHYQNGEYAECLHAAESAILRRPNSVMASVLKIACHEHTGNSSAAQFEAARLHDQLPGMTAAQLREYLPVAQPEMRDQLIGRLERAGL